MKAFVFPGLAIPREGTGGETEDRAPSGPAARAGRAQRHGNALSGLHGGWGGIFHVVTSLGHQEQSYPLKNRRETRSWWRWVLKEVEEQPPTTRAQMAQVGDHWSISTDLPGSVLATRHRRIE